MRPAGGRRAGSVLGVGAAEGALTLAAVIAVALPPAALGGVGGALPPGVQLVEAPLEAVGGAVVLTLELGAGAIVRPLQTHSLALGPAFELTDTPPILLRLDASVGRNWEGIARLGDRGFLIATDKFPETLLGFVPHRRQE